MNKFKKAPGPMGQENAKRLIESISRRHGIPALEAAKLILKFINRAEANNFGKGWWAELLDAQFQTHIGSYERTRCGRETQLGHLTPGAGTLCHDCGCARGEYHVFGCDSEECSHCHEQAFCCDCDDGSDKTQAEADDQ